MKALITIFILISLVLGQSTIKHDSPLSPEPVRTNQEPVGLYYYSKMECKNNIIQNSVVSMTLWLKIK